MSQWYDDYMRRLNSIQSANPGASNSATDIAARLLSHGTPNYTPPTPAPKTGGWFRPGFRDNTKFITDFIIRPGATLLDNIARGNYAVANVFTNAAEQGKTTSLDIIPGRFSPFKGIRNKPSEGRTSLKEDFDAFMRGLTLKEKNTFGDALREAGMGEGFGRAVTGFGLDVVADPINLIPAAWIAKGVGKAGEAASKIPGLNRPIVSGTTETVTESLPESVRVAPKADDTIPTDVAASPAPVERTGADFLNDIWGPDSKTRKTAVDAYIDRATVSGFPASSQAEELFDVGEFANRSLMDTVNKTLRDVPSSRQAPKYFRDDVPIGTEPIYEDVVKTVKKQQGGVDPRQYVMQMLAGREFRARDPREAILRPPREYVGRTQGGRVSRAQLASWVNEGKTSAEKASRARILNNTIADAVNAELKTGKIKPGQKSLTFIAGGKGHNLTFDKIMQDVLDDTPIEALANPATGRSKANWVLKGSDPKKPVRYPEFIQSLRDNIAKLPASETVEQQVTKRVKTGEKVIYGRSRPDFLSHEQWKLDMKKAGFTDEEIKYVLRNANLGEKNYDSAIQKLIGSPFSREYTIPDFIDAVRNGQIDDTSEAIQKMYRMLGINLSKHKTPKARIRQFENKINALQKKLGKNPELATAANKALEDSEGQGLLFDLTKKEAKASKMKVSASSKKDMPANPDSPWHEKQLEAEVAPKAEDIVEEAATVHGDAAVEEVLNSAKVQITPEQAIAVTNAVEGALQKQFGSRLPGQTWQYRTNRGVHRTSKTPGKGWGRFPAFTRRAQYTLIRDMHKQLLAAGAYSGAPNGQMAEILLNSLKASDEVLRAKGISPILNDGFSGTPLSTYDVLSTLGPEWTSKFYLGRSGVPITSTLEAVDVLIDAQKQGGVSGKEIVSALRTIAQKHIPAKGGKTAEPYFMRAAKEAEPNNPMKFVDENFVKPLINALPEFTRIAEQNRAIMGLQVGEATKRLSDEFLDSIIKQVESGNFAAAIAKMANIKPEITAAAKANEVSHIGGIGHMAQEQIELNLGEAGAGLSDAAKAAEKVAAAKGTREVIEASSEHLAKMDSQLDNVIMRETEIKQWEIAQNLYWRLDAKMFKLFAPHAGNAALRPFLIGEQVFASSNSKRYMRTLSELTRKYKTDDINAAFNQIRTQGVGDNPTGVLADMDRMIKQVFDPENPRFDTLNRNGVLVSEMNRQMDHFAVQKNLRFKNNLDEWTSWDVDDPLDFLAKMQTATQQIMAYKVVGSDFSTRFGISKPKDGYVRITNKSGKDSVIYNYIDPKKYYPQEMAQQLSVMDNYLIDMSKPANRNKIVRWYDTVLYALKAGYTIYRPGHHARNALGDGWFNYMDGVRNPKYYKNATRLLATGRNRYTDFEFNKALASNGNMATVTSEASQAPVGFVKINGRKVNISAARGYQLMYRDGALPDHMVIEDLRYDNIIGGEQPTSNSKIPEWVRKPFGGKVREGAVRFSEVRDHYFRAAHWIHAMENGKLPKGWKGTDNEAIEYLSREAAKRIRKFHPDGSDLTRFEREYARRAITFYSWARKAIPLVIEQMVLRPGRFMQYPKAMHNMAQGMGIDLEGGYGNPFPEDQLFPSFLRESVQGPIAGQSGNYWGLRTGNPGMDIIDEYLYGAGPALENLGQSVSPILRAPMELAFGAKAGTRTPIMDYSDYIGQQIPNMSYADKVSNALIGRTVSSGFTDDLYTAKSNEGYKPSPPGGLPSVGLFNWLAGMGLLDMSKPSYIKTAEREIPEGKSR